MNYFHYLINITEGYSLPKYGIYSAANITLNYYPKEHLQYAENHRRLTGLTQRGDISNYLLPSSFTVLTF